MKILKYFDNSCLVETKMGQHDRMKAADTYHSIHPCFLLHRAKMFAQKRQQERLQIHIRVNYTQNVTI